MMRNLHTFKLPSSAAVCRGVALRRPSVVFTESETLMHCLMSASMSLCSESTSPLSTARWKECASRSLRLNTGFEKSHLFRPMVARARA